MKQAVRSLTAWAETARLLDREQVTAVALALGHDLEQYEAPATPDDDLVAVTDRPYETVADAERRLHELEALLRERGDRRAVFLTVYTRMTTRIRERIEAGRFRNPRWMRRYTTTFANYYRRAFLAFERGDLGAVPAPWRVAFGSALWDRTLVVQEAFLGINAHVTYDLALTLRDVGIDPNRAARRSDHRAVNAVLASLVDAQQRALADTYAAGLADVDEAFGNHDERFCLLGLTKARAFAWQVAHVLTDARWPPVASLARSLLRVTATGGAAFILGPALNEDLAARLRAVEREGDDATDLLAAIEARLDETA